MEHAEEIDTVIDPNSDPIEVWLSNDGNLSVLIPNELTYANSDKKIKEAKIIDEETQLNRCGRCRQMSIFKKDKNNRWHCIECPKEERGGLQIEEGYVPPFLRNLPSGGNINAKSELWRKLTASQKSIIYDKRKDEKQLKSLIKKLEHQQDVEDSAKALALE